MKTEDFAFVNRQLAGMLKSGVPLDGALRQLAENLDNDSLGGELQAVERDLAAGVALEDAVQKRNLPEFYKKMIKIGVASNNLPGMLLNLADYYARRGAMWARLKGLLAYPLIVLALASFVSCFIAVTYSSFLRDLEQGVNFWGRQETPSDLTILFLWMPSITLALLFLAALVIALAPGLREALRWRLPAFRDASLTQIAGALSMMLKGGATLPDAIDLAAGLEQGTPAGHELTEWRGRLSEGHQDLSRVVTAGTAFPPMFVWLVSESGENAEEGLDRAKEIYDERARRRSEMLLHSVLPVAVVVVGLLIVAQTVPLFIHLQRFLDFMSY